MSRVTHPDNPLPGSRKRCKTVPPPDLNDSAFYNFQALAQPGASESAWLAPAIVAGAEPTSAPNETIAKTCNSL